MKEILKNLESALDSGWDCEIKKHLERTKEFVWKKLDKSL